MGVFYCIYSPKQGLSLMSSGIGFDLKGNRPAFFLDCVKIITIIHNQKKKPVQPIDLMNKGKDKQKSNIKKAPKDDP